MVGKIKGLDGLRAISVLLVIMSHAEAWQALGITSTAVRSALSAQTGVNVFFVLSGFLITFLLIKEKDATGKVDIIAFIKRRALRIFPLYYLAIFFLMYIDYTSRANIPNCSFAYALTYTVNFYPKECAYSAMSHFWSLSVEEHFYLFWPLIFCLGNRVAFITATAIAVACVTIGTSIYPESQRFYMNRWTFPAMLPILAGCMLAFVCNANYIKTLFTDKSKSNILLVSILFGTATPAFFSSDAIWLTSVCALVLYIYHNQGSTLVRMLEIKPLAALGIISYGLYVWQGIFTGNGPYRGGATFPPSVDIGVWLTFVVAPLSYIFFERPLINLKSRYSWKSKPQSAAQDKNIPQHE
ncbi:acyltransferase family protein [Pseudomonas taiwanensis]|uniref:acyltransferase family protein n=1 Tax=Pseudomonas taiwanensis TaxID=470150 RepID=UPI000481B484|nr:acyltransferase [Pseudomonas taiwanensis]